MYMYDKKENGVIDVYSMHLKKQEAKDFKYEFINKKDKNDLFYILKTNSAATLHDYEYSRNINIEKINYKDKYYFSELTNMKFKNRKHKKILENYIENYYYSYPITVKDELKELYYLYITQDVELKFDTFVLENMFNLPKELYRLHLLQQGFYENLENENIEKQLELFDYEYVKSESIEDFLKEKTTFYKQIIDRIESSTRILKLVKKK